MKLVAKTKYFSGVALFICVLLLFYEASQPPKTFQEAKSILAKMWALNNFTTEFYCQVPFNIENNQLRLVSSDVYAPRKPLNRKNEINTRTTIVEFEHIMPAHNFGQHLECWKKGGRKECKKDALFNKMESDPYNLVPAIGEINGDRSNYRYAEAPKGLLYNQYGNCKVYTDFKAKRFYPADYSKGLIARTYLYMSEAYGVKLSDQERKLMQAWDKMYPPNEYEIQRNKIIEQMFLWKIVFKIKSFFI